MKLSIIVPVYNMAADNKLEHCLSSLVNQTVKDYEIIVVNDASTDDSLLILRRYEKEYPNLVKVIDLKENHRQGGAKNAGLDKCSGSYIGFVDSDDWVMPDMYEKLLLAAEETDSDMAVCNLTHVFKYTMQPADNFASIEEGMYGELTGEKRKKLILHSGALVCRIYKKHIFMEPKLRFPEHMFYEDNAIGTELLFRAKKIAYINEPLYFYLQNSASTVHTYSEEKCRDRLKTMEMMVSLAKEGGYFDEYHDEIEYRFTNLFYQNTLFSYMRIKGRKKLSFIRKLGKEMKETFPKFENNRYYVERINKEEKFLMALQQKSTLLFVFYYKALWFYRKIRYKK